MSTLTQSPNDPAAVQSGQHNESRRAGTRRRLHLPETVTDTDMFNLKE